MCALCLVNTKINLTDDNVLVVDIVNQQIVKSIVKLFSAGFDGMVDPRIRSPPTSVTCKIVSSARASDSEKGVRK